MYSQENLELIFEQHEVLQKSAMGFTRPFQLTNGKIPTDNEIVSIKFPSEFDSKDTSYFTIYFTGQQKGLFEKSTVCLLGHDSVSDYKIWVDHNNDLDFSNDPVIEAGNDSSFIIRLHHANNSNAIFPVRFEKFKFPDSTPMGSGGKQDDGSIMRSPKYWLADQRMNTRSTVVETDGRTYKVGLFDANCNGKYNDIGKDLLMVNIDSSLALSTQVIKGANLLSDTMLIELNHEVYRLTELTENGATARLEKSNLNYKSPLRIGATVTDLQLLSIDSTTNSLAALYSKKKYTMLYFWGSWCGGCKYQFKDIKDLSTNYADQLTVIALNYGDTPEFISNYHAENQLNWWQGTLTKEVETYFSIDGYPTCILIDQEGTILSYEHNSLAIKTMLENVKEETK